MRSWKTHVLALSSVALAALLGLASIQRTVGRVSTQHSGSPPISVGLATTATVGQEFVAEYDGLCSVALVIEGQAEQGDEALTFHLQKDPSSGDDLVVLRIDASEIGSGSYHTFEFPRIPHSAGESFVFSLEVAGRVPGGTLSVTGIAEDTYPHGEAVLGGLEGDYAVRDLAFRLGYDPPALDKVRVFMDRLVANKPSVWGDKFFYIALALAHSVLVYVLLLRVAGPNAEEN